MDKEQKDLLKTLNLWYEFLRTDGFYSVCAELFSFKTSL